MNVSAETNHLLARKVRQALEPLQISASAILATSLFAAVYGALAFAGNFRYSALAKLGFLLAFGGIVAIAVLAWQRHKQGLASRGLFVIAAALTLAGISGYRLGTRCWLRNTSKYYNWKDMASYVNIDPASDKGQSFMDAGFVYFKDGSVVQSSTAVAFRNGLTFCAAPIVRTGTPMTEYGSDWWAVGTDCCGKNGEAFTCGDAETRLARSGVRMLDETQRAMFLLAVQEWSATNGLAVRHPLFFQWVRDPVNRSEYLYTSAWQDYYASLTACFVLSLLASFGLSCTLQKLGIS